MKKHFILFIAIAMAISIGLLRQADLALDGSDTDLPPQHDDGGGGTI